MSRCSAAIFLAFPIIARQIYTFVAPGLYKRERKAFVPYLVATPVFFVLGALLVYFVVTPMALRFFLGMQETDAGRRQIEMQTRVSEYLGFIMTLIIAFGICFQLPVVLTLLARIELVGSQAARKGPQIRDRRHPRGGRAADAARSVSQIGLSRADVRALRVFDPRRALGRKSSARQKLAAEAQGLTPAVRGLITPVLPRRKRPSRSGTFPHARHQLDQGQCRSPADRRCIAHRKNVPALTAAELLALDDCAQDAVDHTRSRTRRRRAMRSASRSARPRRKRTRPRPRADGQVARLKEASRPAKTSARKADEELRNALLASPTCRKDDVPAGEDEAPTSSISGRNGNAATAAKARPAEAELLVQAEGALRDSAKPWA